MEVTITIDRVKVLGIVEGISATIAQHNSGSPSFESVWASAAERPKLDIWWRDGIVDLESSLAKWATATSAQFDLSADGDNYTLTLDAGSRWNTKVSNLLANKIQQYMVHVVVAGWLADFRDVAAPDYRQIAAGDIEGILQVLLYRDLAFEVEERSTDNDDKSEDEGGVKPDQRKADTDSKSDDDGSLTPDERSTDNDDKSEDEGGVKPDQRSTDNDDKSEDEGGVKPDQRKADTDSKSDAEGSFPAGIRDKDDDKCPSRLNTANRAGIRDKDDFRRLRRRPVDHIDWNGAGVMIIDN